MNSSDLEDEAERVAKRIRARGEWVSDDLRIKLETAAPMIDIKPEVLRNWVYLGKGPPAVRMGARKPMTFFITDILRMRKAALTCGGYL
jgi:hypothetical protein